RAAALARAGAGLLPVVGGVVVGQAGLALRGRLVVERAVVGLVGPRTAGGAGGAVEAQRRQAAVLPLVAGARGGGGGRGPGVAGAPHGVGQLGTGAPAEPRALVSIGLVRAVEVRGVDRDPAAQRHDAGPRARLLAGPGDHPHAVAHLAHLAQAALDPARRRRVVTFVIARCAGDVVVDRVVDVVDVVGLGDPAQGFGAVCPRYRRGELGQRRLDDRGVGPVEAVAPRQGDEGIARGAGVIAHERGELLVGQ